MYEIACEERGFFSLGIKLVFRRKMVTHSEQKEGEKVGLPSLRDKGRKSTSHDGSAFS